jgi:hypothetical protein
VSERFWEHWLRLLKLAEVFGCSDAAFGATAVPVFGVSGAAAEAWYPSAHFHS